MDNFIKNLNVRIATVTDTVFITLLSAELGYDMTAGETKKLIEEIGRSSNDIIYVAEANEKIAGWIHAFITTRLESGVFCEIGGLVVSDLYKGKGIGSLLVAEVKKWYSEKNIAILKVRSNVKREAAHKFYLREGFTEIKQQKVFEIKL